MSGDPTVHPAGLSLCSPKLVCSLLVPLLGISLFHSVFVFLNLAFFVRHGAVRMHPGCCK